MGEVERKAKRQETEGSIKANIDKAQAKQKEYYDHKYGAASCFGIGSIVLKKDFTIGRNVMAGSLTIAGRALNTITSSLGKGLFQLKEMNGGKVLFV